MKRLLKFKIGRKEIIVSALNICTLTYFLRASLINFARAMSFSTSIVVAVVITICFSSLAYYLLIEEKKINWDGILVILLCFAFFQWTIRTHPEYQVRFDDIRHNGRFSMRSVFSFGAAIYCYFLIRLYKNKNENLYGIFRIFPYLLLFFNIWTMLFNRVDEYKIDFGYQMEMAAILFLAQYLFEKGNKHHLKLVLSLLSILMGVLYGSRACIIGYIVFVILFFIWQHHITPRQLLLMFIGVLAAIMYSSNAVMMMIYRFFSSLGLHSRTLYYIALGNILAVDTARQDRIWPVLIEAIKNSSPFLIRGAYGGRYLLNEWWPYEHNIFLEILLTLGVFWGSCIILFIIWKTVRALNYDKDIGGLLLIVFLSFSVCKLFFSSSFWNEPYFWSYLAMMMNVSKKRTNVHNNSLDLYV